MRGRRRRDWFQFFQMIDKFMSTGDKDKEGGIVDKTHTLSLSLSLSLFLSLMSVSVVSRFPASRVAGVRASVHPNHAIVTVHSHGVHVYNVSKHFVGWIHA